MRYCLKIFACVVVLSFSVPSWAGAFSLNTPFGGKIITSIPCTCSVGSWVTVAFPRPGSFIYTPGLSQIYRNYQLFRPGPWALGIASGFGTCMVGAPPYCVSIGSGPIIRKVGTSF